MTAIWAAVPVKEFVGAKQRLSSLLSPAQRRALAAAMVEDVLQALAAAPLAGIMVNTLDPEATALALRYRARVVTQGAREGHTGAVEAMGRILVAEGVPAMLTVPGDIPAVTSEEITRLCAAAPPAPSFSIAPAHDEKGSNAVLLSPPGVVKLRFGDDSYFPHLDAARRAGVAPTVVRLPGIARDVDTPEDLLALLASGLAPRSRAVTLARGFLG